MLISTYIISILFMSENGMFANFYFYIVPDVK